MFRCPPLLRDQTAFNIREWASRRKQKPVRGPESPSKRLRCLFGILRGGWRVSWLRGALSEIGACHTFLRKAQFLLFDH